jgi:hypothetical protein
VATKPETLFYRRVNDKLTHAVHRQKITSLYGNGTPDFWYSGQRCDGWVEYKWVSSLPKHGVDPTKLLSSLQLKWINDRTREGRYCMVIIGSPAGCAILEDGAWNTRIPVNLFRYSASDVSAVLTERFHDVSAAFGAHGFGDQSDVSNSNDLATDSRRGV